MHLNIDMFTTGNIHLKYKKHHVHSAAHKLKIRSSRLVLTTAGTDPDSTDRAAIGGAKNSSASEPLKRPILSLWNSVYLVEQDPLVNTFHAVRQWHCPATRSVGIVQFCRILLQKAQKSYAIPKIQCHDFACRLCSFIVKICP